jgi:hypothetical protein
MPEMAALELTPVNQIAAMLRRSDPIVALRALAETQLNKGFDRLKVLIADDRLWARWQSCADDPEVESADHRYATQLRAFKAAQTS